MDPTAPETRHRSGLRTPSYMESGCRRRGRPCPCPSPSRSNQRRTNRSRSRWPPSLAFRELPAKLLFACAVFAATLSLKGGVLASSNPLELNGGSCLAMAGKGCVALAVDRRFGLEGQLVSTEAKRVLKVRRRLQACKGHAGVPASRCSNSATCTAFLVSIVPGQRDTRVPYFVNTSWTIALVFSPSGKWNQEIAGLSRTRAGCYDTRPY